MVACTVGPLAPWQSALQPALRTHTANKGGDNPTPPLLLPAPLTPTAGPPPSPHLTPHPAARWLCQAVCRLPWQPGLATCAHLAPAAPLPLLCPPAGRSWRPGPARTPHQSVRSVPPLPGCGGRAWAPPRRTVRQPAQRGGTATKGCRACGQGEQGVKEVGPFALQSDRTTPEHEWLHNGGSSTSSSRPATTRADHSPASPAQQRGQHASKGGRGAHQDIRNYDTVANHNTACMDKARQGSLLRWRYRRKRVTVACSQDASRQAAAAAAGQHSSSRELDSDGMQWQNENSLVG